MVLLSLRSNHAMPCQSGAGLAPQVQQVGREYVCNVWSVLCYAVGELHPSTHQPFDLLAIYKDCPKPPAHLAHLLAPQAEGAAMAAGSGGAAGRPRFGMSKRHSGETTAGACGCG